MRDLVCNLLRSRRAVVLGLEYPVAEQRFLGDFLRSPTRQGRRALLASPFWARATQDGRTSRAMLALLDWARAQIAAGARNRVFAFDAPPETATPDMIGKFDARDAAMAARVSQVLANPGPR